MHCTQLNERRKKWAVSELFTHELMTRAVAKSQQKMWQRNHFPLRAGVFCTEEWTPVKWWFRSLFPPTFLQPAPHSSSILPLLLFSVIFSFHNKHPLPSSLPFIRLVFSCKNVSDKTFSLLQCRNFLCVPCQPSGTLWILFRKKKRWKINCIKQMRMHNLGGFSLPLKGNFANLAAALICTAVSISCVASSGCSNTDMQLEEMGVRTAQEISAESWSTCSLLCSSSNAPKGGKLRPKSRQLSRVSALEGFGWRFSVWTRYYVFVSFVREGVGDYGLDLNFEFGRRILITEEGEWLLNSVLQCNAGLDRDMFLDAQASLALTPASPFVRHTFGFPFCQRLWAITKHPDDKVVATGVDKLSMEVNMMADMVADLEVDMVAEMEVD